MRVISHLDEDYADWAKSMIRRAVPDTALRDLVASIIEQVASQGDAALLDLTKRFDGLQLDLDQLFVSADEMQTASASVRRETREAVAAALENIHAFAQQSLRRDWSRINAQGAEVGERFTPFDRVGVYVPGGKAPLVSTALMTAGFAQAAGVPEIVAATPVGPDGRVNADVLYAMQACGVKEVLKVGGAQAIAALALGTARVKPVDRIVGPGNRYVVEAKRQLVGAVSIDLLPGPSEILILADETANAHCVAADMLAQAEHGGDSAVGLLSPSMNLIQDVIKAIEHQLASLKRSEIIKSVLAQGTFLVHVESLEQGMNVVNAYAPEHLSLIVADEARYLTQVRTAGAIYVGNDSPVAVGDFLAGPSHTLPTGGAGRSFSGLRADQFQRRTSIVKMSRASVRASLATVEEFARIEGLDAHGRSVAIRLEQQ